MYQELCAETHPYIIFCRPLARALIQSNNKNAKSNERKTKAILRTENARERCKKKDTERNATEIVQNV